MEEGKKSEGGGYWFHVGYILAADNKIKLTRYILLKN